MTECPNCGATLQYRSLAYKHRCPKIIDEAEQAAQREAKIKNMQIRAASNLGKRMRKHVGLTNDGDGPRESYEASAG